MKTLNKNTKIQKIESQRFGIEQHNSKSWYFLGKREKLNLLINKDDIRKVFYKKTFYFWI